MVYWTHHWLISSVRKPELRQKSVEKKFSSNFCPKPKSNENYITIEKWNKAKKMKFKNWITISGTGVQTAFPLFFKCLWEESICDPNWLYHG